MNMSSSGVCVHRLPLVEIRVRGGNRARIFATGESRLAWRVSNGVATPDADCVLLVDDAHPDWVIERAAELSAVGYEGVVAALAPASSEFVAAGYRSGVHTWFQPSISVEEIVEAIRVLVRRFYGLGSADELEVVMKAGDRSVTIDGVRFQLRPRGFALLAYLLARRERRVSQLELLHDVFDTHHEPDSSLVRVHISQLRDDLGVYDWIINSEERHGYRISIRRDGTPARTRVPHPRRRREA